MLPAAAELGTVMLETISAKEVRTAWLAKLFAKFDSITLELPTFTVTVLPVVPTSTLASVLVEPPGARMKVCVLGSPLITTVLVNVLVAAPKLV